MKEVKLWSLTTIPTIAKGNAFNEDQSFSFLLLPGVSLLPDGVLVFLYSLVLIYVFIGVYLTMDVLVESIDLITSQQKILKQFNPRTKRNQEAKVKIWYDITSFNVCVRNPAIANLTLVIIASCAPELLLLLIETVQHLSMQQDDDQIQGQSEGQQMMGLPVIIGSAAFNILVNTAISIGSVTKAKDQGDNHDLKVERGVKRIKFLGHYVIIVVSNIMTYVWLLIVLKLSSHNQIEIWEALITIGLYIPLIAVTYGYDKFREKREMRRLSTVAIQDNTQDVIVREEVEEDSKSMQSSPRKQKNIRKGSEQGTTEKIIKYAPIEFYRILIAEKKGTPLKNYDEQRKRKEMKDFLMKTLQTDDIEKVVYNDLKRVLEGESLVSRFKYRQWFSNILSTRREIVSKDQNQIKEDQKDFDGQENPYFGFKCLSYSVNESIGFIEIDILNKKKTQGVVAIRTVSKTAKAGYDFQRVDKTLKFKKDQELARIKVYIKDDDEQEPDREFLVELYDPNTGYPLKGKDAKSQITIIDDDNPGILSFEKTQLNVLASQEEVIVTVVRKHGCKGYITCKYKTVDMEERENKAIAGQDYERTQGILDFKNNEVSRDIHIKLLNKRQIDPDDFGMVFGLKIYEPQPEGIVKISMKDICTIKIDLDNEFQLKQEILDQYLWTMERIANRTWESQIKTAIMLNPTLHLDGIVEDVTNYEAFIHFLTINWKALIALIPPPNILRGWATLLSSLVIIGFQMLLILEFGKLFGCVTGLGPTLTSLIIISGGISLPNVITSWQAASYSKYADNALIGLQCSMGVNVQLGIGLSWLISSTYSIANQKTNFIDSEQTQTLVYTFLATYVACVIILFLRRMLIGGELGGNKRLWKYLSVVVVLALWVIFIGANAVIIKTQ